MSVATVRRRWFDGSLHLATFRVNPKLHLSGRVNSNNTLEASQVNQNLRVPISVLLLPPQGCHEEEEQQQQWQQHVLILIDY